MEILTPEDLKPLYEKDFKLGEETIHMPEVKQEVYGDAIKICMLEKASAEEKVQKLKKLGIEAKIIR